MIGRGTEALRIDGATGIAEMIEMKEEDGTGTAETGTGITSAGRAVRLPLTGLTETDGIVLGGLLLLTNVSGMMSLMAAEGVLGTIAGILLTTFHFIYLFTN